ncbi:mitochondrial chaperone BCS1 [Angomonas deanei]|uniref:ATPase family associated with various cellular activities (AAA)/AAA domain (Dynein-related subfamily), putative n=1 Tax=Angomonas deanei TaxID=59799 RepID=A0A7G2CFI3_9TRYP|nr:mitochondrial chaperone BCS1 [Angomonas deanei]CAD2217731.1 ATPase family associated with various cellular activities (AAA)/AAA domain (dynein-related subfamily), putative [Angomonas deanei]|eukprot:EPY20447.1 mitochondrial chaperone BCS1 [Angomonas deanei]
MVERGLHYLNTSSRTKIKAYKANRNSSAFNENIILREAVLQYTAKKIKPQFDTGDYEYVRAAVSAPADADMAELLKHYYQVRTTPTKGEDVEINGNALSMSIEDDSEEDNNGEQQQQQQKGGDDKRKKAPKGEKLSTIGLYANISQFSRVDETYELVKEAYEWFKKESKKKSGSTRYLYQPLLKEKPISVAAEGEDDDDKNDITCQRYPLVEEKTFKSLFFPQKKSLVQLVDQFEARAGKFAVPGHPHKLVILLYGPPGTGKTSLVKAIAAHTKRSIFSIPLARVKTNRRLMSFMYDGKCTSLDEDGNRKNHKIPPKEVIYVLEDVDAATDTLKKKVEAKTDIHLEVREEGETTPAPEDKEEEAKTEETSPSKDGESPDEGGEDKKDEEEEEEGEESEGEGDDDKKEKKKKEKVVKVEKVGMKSKKNSDKLSIKGMLEALNGVLDSPGRIVILTTNHIQHLDPALLRPGVVTMKLFMGLFSADCAIEMIRHYNACSGKLNEETLNEIRKELQGPIAEMARQEEVNDLLLSDKANMSKGFTPAELEQLCAECDNIDELLTAIKRGTQNSHF